MKNILISFFVVFCFSQETIDGIIAVVGENIVTQSEFIDQLKVLAQRRGINPQTTPLQYEKLAEDLLNNIVNQYVLLEHAKKDTNIVIDDNQVKQQLEMQVSGFIKELGSEEALEKYFNKSIREIKAYYWKEIYNAMLIERFRYSLVGVLSVGKKEVDDFFIMYKDSLPPVPKRGTFSVLNLQFSPGEKTIKTHFGITAALKDSLDQNLVSFELLAKRHSDDFASASSGGFVGETERGSFLYEYEEAAFSANIGDVLGPIKTSAGFHIIKLIDKKGEKITTQHLLKTIQPSKEDKDSVIQLINSFYERSLEDSLFLFNLLDKDVAFSSVGFSGNYGGFYYENMPVEIISFIDSGTKNLLSSPFGFSNGSLGLVYLYDKLESEEATLKNSYEYISSLVLEKKMGAFIDSWLITAKKDVYINIFIEN